MERKYRAEQNRATSPGVHLGVPAMTTTTTGEYSPAGGAGAGAGAARMPAAYNCATHATGLCEGGPPCAHAAPPAHTSSGPGSEQQHQQHQQHQQQQQQRQQQRQQPAVLGVPVARWVDSKTFRDEAEVKSEKKKSTRKKKGQVEPLNDDPSSGCCAIM